MLNGEDASVTVSDDVANSLLDATSDTVMDAFPLPDAVLDGDMEKGEVCIIHFMLKNVVHLLIQLCIR